MTLVDYPSSSSDSENQPAQAPLPHARAADTGPNELKRKRHVAPSPELPPLPSNFHDLYATAARVSTQDDSSLHGGRTRAVPHVQGNWPSHVYLEWYPSPTESSLLSSLIADLDPSSDLHSLLHSDLGTPQPLHISLSQTLNLSADQRLQFLSTLTSQIQAPSAVKNVPQRRNQHVPHEPEKHIEPFVTSLSTLHWVSNESQNRWFLVIRVDKPASNELNRLLQVCNSVADAYGQEKLYAKNKEVARKEDAAVKRTRTSHSVASEKTAKAKQCQQSDKDLTDRFHVSIAWTLKDPAKEIAEDTGADDQPETGFWEAKNMDEIRKLRLQFETVKVKIGNEVHSIKLFNRLSEKSRGILG